MAENVYKWYVLRVISGKENKVREYIEGALQTSSLFKEYVSQVLVPMEKVVTTDRNGKRAIKERNKLPGYVLVECNLTSESQYLLRNIPNVLGYLSDGRNDNKPAPVSQAEINRMVGEVDETELNLLLDETYVVGEKVKVVEGPFKGFSGVVQEVMQEKHKMRVVVTIFDRQTPLELSFSQVDRE
ncbi:MAG: transcription termination/antitermination protein NusG [Paludibacteraceae bacterium]|nr:transcription termination/antitermination protein NusG [Paludibacteraceae bacterium]